MEPMCLDGCITFYIDINDECYASTKEISRRFKDESHSEEISS